MLQSIGSPNLPATPPTFTFSQGSEILGEGGKRHGFDEYKCDIAGELHRDHRCKLREELDSEHRCKLCEELDRDPCFELVEELDRDHCFRLAGEELDCNDRFRLGKDGDDIGERLLWLTGSKTLTELDVDERGVLR